MKVKKVFNRFLFLIVVVLFVCGLFYEGITRFMARQGEDIGRPWQHRWNRVIYSSLKQFKRNSYRKSRLEFYRHL